MLHNKCVTICFSRYSSPIFTLMFSHYFHFQYSKTNADTVRPDCGLYVFPILFPWHGSSHSRQHWSDLLEMNGLITASERRRNTVWRGDEWNWGLGLRKPLRQIEGINDCNTARGPQRPTPSSLALWLCNGFPWLLFSGIGRATAFSDTVADRMFFSTPLCLYKVSKRVLSETTKTTCPTLLRHDDPKPPEMQWGILKSLIRYIWWGTLMSNAI